MIDDLAGILPALVAAPPHEFPETLARELRERLGILDTELYLVDFTARYLDQVGGHPPRRWPLAEAPAPRRAQREGRVVEDGAHVWVPVARREEIIGILRLEPGAPLDERGRVRLKVLGILVAHAIREAETYSDVFARVRRRHADLSIAAEIQWGLFPALSYVGRRFHIAGAFEPIAAIAGDTFDYAERMEGVQYTMTDAMGHGVEAALLASLAVATLRNGRREGADLVAQARAVDEVVYRQFGREQFLTAILVELLLPARVLRLVNAGHPAPLLWQDGELRTLDVPADLPLGMFGDSSYGSHDVQLAPGARLLFVSDGILEEWDASGREFGMPRLREVFMRTIDSPPPRAVRAVTEAVLAWGGGRMRDDATAVCLDVR